MIFECWVFVLWLLNCLRLHFSERKEVWLGLRPAINSAKRKRELHSFSQQQATPSKSKRKLKFSFSLLIGLLLSSFHSAFQRAASQSCLHSVHFFTPFIQLLLRALWFVEEELRVGVVVCLPLAEPLPRAAAITHQWKKTTQLSSSPSTASLQSNISLWKKWLDYGWVAASGLQSIISFHFIIDFTTFIIAALPHYSLILFFIKVIFSSLSSFNEKELTKRN